MYDLPAILQPGNPGTDTISIIVVKALRSGVNAAAALSTITFVFIFLCAFILVRVLGANVVADLRGREKPDEIVHDVKQLLS